MTKRKSCHLIDMLAEVFDQRNNKGKRHPLESILGLLFTGATRIADMMKYYTSNPKLAVNIIK